MKALSLLRRLGFFLLTLVLIDMVGQFVLADRLAQSLGTRLPENQETGFLQGFIDRLEAESGQEQASASPEMHTGIYPTQLVFLGSSPTWGVTIRDPNHTYPAAFQAAQEETLPLLSVHNFAAKGFLAADLNTVLGATLNTAEGFVIQLNYHTFSPKLLGSTPIRHPDLPERLGVPVTADEAKMLGMRPTPVLNWNASLRAGLRRIWWFYREREKLALLALGATPESWVYHRFYPEKPAEEIPEAKPFYELKPARQLYIVKRYAENASYELDDLNIELRFVKIMLARLKAAHKPAVFFIAPINVDSLRFYEVMDWKQYRRNMDKLRKVVEAEGFKFVDINLTEPLPEDAFADISHTLDNGGQAFGKKLWALSRDYFEKRL
ncbi:MAG: hypothetical protein ACAI44_37430 [Candidatus Sericytochromatia bacterium]